MILLYSEDYQCFWIVEDKKEKPTNAFAKGTIKSSNGVKIYNNNYYISLEKNKFSIKNFSDTKKTTMLFNKYVFNLDKKIYKNL